MCCTHVYVTHTTPRHPAGWKSPPDLSQSQDLTISNNLLIWLWHTEGRLAAPHSGEHHSTPGSRSEGREGMSGAQPWTVPAGIASAGPLPSSPSCSRILAMSEPPTTPTFTFCRSRCRNAAISAEIFWGPKQSRQICQRPAPPCRSNETDPRHGAGL